MARYDEWRQQGWQDSSPGFRPGQRFRGNFGGRGQSREPFGGRPYGGDFQGYGGQRGRETGQGRYGGDFRDEGPGRWGEARGRGYDQWGFRGHPDRGQQGNQWGGGGLQYPRWAEWRPGSGSHGFHGDYGNADGVEFQDQEMFGEPVDDDEIRAAVQQNLRIDRYLRSEGIQVKVEDGVVTLAGEVDDYLHARYAWDDTWDTRGVRGVLSRLQVRETDEAEEDDSDSAEEAEAG